LVGELIEHKSTLTPYEYITILPSIQAFLEPKKFNCVTCLLQNGTSEKLIGKTEAKRKSKGCFDYTTRKYKLKNIVYNSCLGNFTKEIDYIIEAFSHYEKGMLPYKGTLAEQPNKIIEIFDLISSMRSEHFEKEKQGK
jgi:hypothetical protein